MTNEKPKKTTPQTLISRPGQRIPFAAVIWLIVTVILFLIGSQTVTMRDQERFPNDFQVEVTPLEAENTIRLNIVAGTFTYGVDPRISNPVDTGTYVAEQAGDATTLEPSGNPVVERLVSNIPDVTEVIIEDQTIRIVYDNDIEADLMLRRAQRPFTNAVLNPSQTITSRVASDAENTMIFTTTDEQWLFGRYNPALIPEGEEEIYTSRSEAESGSELAQFIAERVTSVEALELHPDHLIVTHREGAIVDQVATRITDALNAFHPRATLQPNLWLFSLQINSERILSIRPLDTGIPLYIFSLAFAAIEFVMFLFLRGTNDKLIRPLTRVAGIFLFFWSLYGHEPLWDYIMGLIFPTSRQLVHPNATVIQFTAQHLELVIVSSLITIPAGLLIGILVTRENFREILPLVNNLVNSGQTVPTIAIVAFMAPLIGFGFWPAIIALVAYGLLPVVRNTIAGLEAVDNFIIDSARGMGMTPAQILFRIELPIASSIIMAGIRTSMVINVGTATLGAFVGSGGLGTPIASGLAMTIDSFILLGALPAAILAILIDYVLGRIEYVLTPRGLQIAS